MEGRSADSPLEAQLQPGPRALITWAAVAGIAAYLVRLRHYGFELFDEGTILYQIHRAASGEIPYRDFATGYTPGFFWLNAMVSRTMGESLGAIRSFLIGVHLVTALSLLLVAGYLVRAWLAPWPTLLWFAFLPLFPGRFCSFNIPYPAWYATAGFLWSALAAMRWRETRRKAWLAAAAAAAALALACKPNSGAFAFMALGLVVLRCGQEKKDPLWWPVWLAIWALVALAFGFRIFSRDFIIYLLPVAVLQALLAAGRIRAAPGRDAQATAVAAWGTVFVAGGLLTFPWVFYFMGLLGAQSFIREVTLIGSGADVIYYIPFPAPGRVAAAAAGALSVIGILGLLLRQLISRRLALATLALAAAGTAAGAATGLWGALAPEGVTRSVVWQIESASFPLALVVHWCALALAGSRVAAAEGGFTGEFALAPRAEVVLIFSLCMFLQLYPRADFMHLVTAAPLSLILGFSLLEESLRGWRRALHLVGPAWLGRLPGLAAAAVLVAALALRLVPNLAALEGPREIALAGPRGRIEISPGGADLFADLARAVAEVERLTAPGQVVFTFPALAAVNFFSQREAPLAHDYFFAGRPGHEEEAEMVEAIRARRPEVIVTMNRDLGFFLESAAYYLILRDFVASRYRPLGRRGRFDILLREDLAAGLGPPRASQEAQAAGDEMGGGASVPLSAQARLLLAADADAPAPLRRAALRAVLDSVEGGGEERGLERLVLAAGLSRSQELLLLRAIRDEGDARAASYLVWSGERDDERLRSEAESAMEMVGERMSVDGFLWGTSGHRPAPAIPAAAWLRGRLVRWLEPGRASPRAQAFAARILGVIGAPGARPRLVGSFVQASDPVVKVAAAEALLRLGFADLACPLVSLLGRIHPVLSHLAPSLVLAAYRQSPERVLPCLTRAIEQGIGARQEGVAVARGREALWIAAATHDPALVPFLEAAAGGGGVLAPVARSALRYARQNLGGRDGG